MGHLLDPVHDELFRPADRSGRATRLHHQYIAVRQNIQGAWVRQFGGERLHFEAWCRDRRRAIPTHDLRDMHRWQKVLVERWQIGISTELAVRIDRVRTAGGQREYGGSRDCAADEPG